MATVLAILFAIIVYAVMVLLTRTITKDEISRKMCIRDRKRCWPLA